MGMKFLSKFIGPLMFQSKLFRLVQGMIGVAGPTNTQKESMESHNFSINEFAEVCMLPLFHLQLLSRPLVFTVLNFNQMHVPLVYIQLVGLSLTPDMLFAYWGLPGGGESLARGGGYKVKESPGVLGHGRQPAQSSLVQSLSLS
eukprot:860793-Pelagomonas_calceolata.AAC.1